jgi:citrate lyase beta subunit
MATLKLMIRASDRSRARSVGEHLRPADGSERVHRLQLHDEALVDPQVEAPLTHAPALVVDAEHSRPLERDFLPSPLQALAALRTLTTWGTQYYHRPVVKTSLSPDAIAPTFARLRAANERFAARFPGDPPPRQPVHTVYGGAHLFKHDAMAKLGAVARRALDDYAPDAATLTHVLGLPGDLAGRIRARVVDKLRREPVEDYRIDFEDGYGVRAWGEEDEHAAGAAREVAKALAEGALPPFFGIRIKALTEEVRERAVRTLDVFLSTLCAETKGTLPPHFVVTLPKVTTVEHVRALVEILAAFEAALALASGALKLEIVVETAQAFIDASGSIGLSHLLDAANGRCVAAHFGPYDYTASCDVTASHQRLDHPANAFARSLMKVAFAGTGVSVCDGPTTLLPIAVHRPPQGGALSDAELEENRATVHRAWRLQFANVTRALVDGIYQGWDLHPAQIPIRYAAVYAFFLTGLDATAARLAHFLERAAQATRFGAHFDDAATGQGLLNYFVRAVGAGALSEADALAATGLSLAELRERSFARILEARRG